MGVCGLNGEYHSRTYRDVIGASIVYVKTDIVAQAVDEVLAQRFTVQIFAMGIDVVVSGFLQRICSIAPQRRFAGLECRNRSLLRPQHNIVNFPLPRGEFSICRQSAGDVGGVHRIFSRRIDYHHIAVLYGL